MHNQINLKILCHLRKKCIETRYVKRTYVCSIMYNIYVHICRIKWSYAELEIT